MLERSTNVHVTESKEIPIEYSILCSFMSFRPFHDWSLSQGNSHWLAPLKTRWLVCLHSPCLVSSSYDSLRGPNIPHYTISRGFSQSSHCITQSIDTYTLQDRTFHLIELYPLKSHYCLKYSNYYYFYYGKIKVSLVFFNFYFWYFCCSGIEKVWCERIHFLIVIKSFY